MTAPDENRVADTLRQMFLADLGLACPAEADGSRFGEIAVTRGLVTPAQRDAALAAQQARPGAKLGEILMQSGALDRRALVAVLKAQREIRPSPLPVIGRYFILDEIGRGAASRVYRAIHEDLLKQVAIKVLSERPGLPASMLTRFRREASAAGRLQHPNIVGVHDVDVAGALQYIVMDYVDGVTMRAWMADPRRTFKERVLLTEKVARAVDHAHKLGVLHRDLKPENILVRADGEPVVVDFGLARSTEEIGLTQEGDVLGTPAYMSPEQVRGQSAALDARSDLFALGVILYEAMTAQLPFIGASAAAVYDGILRADPSPPSRLRPGLPRDVDTVCLRCLEKEPRDRYPSAAELADDLHRLAEGEPITATHLATVVRTWRRLRRRPGPLAAGAAALVLACVALIAFQRVQRERARIDYANRVKSEYIAAQDRLGELVEKAERARYAPSGVDRAALRREIDRAADALPSSTGVREAYRGWALFLVGDERADRVFSDAVRAHPDNPLIPLFSARRRLRVYADAARWPVYGFSPNAVADRPVSFLPEAPDDAKACLDRARADLQSSRRSPVWKEMPELAWIDALCEGYEKYAARDFAGALARLQALADQKEIGLEVRLICAVALVCLGRPEEALSYARRLVDSRPHMVPALRTLAVCQRFVGAKLIREGGDALAHLERAREIQERLGDASETAALDLFIAQAKLARGDSRGAVESARRAADAYERILQRAPDDIIYRVNRACAISLLAQSMGPRTAPEELMLTALADVDHAQRLSPDDPTVLGARADVRMFCCRFSPQARAAIDEHLAVVRGDLARLAEIGIDAASRHYLEAYYHVVEAEAARDAKRPAAEHWRKASEAAARALQAAPRMHVARHLEITARMSLAEEENAPVDTLLKLVAEMEEFVGGVPQQRSATRLAVAGWLHKFAARAAEGPDGLRLARAAQEAWERALASNPGHPECRLNLARMKILQSERGAPDAAGLLRQALADLQPLPASYEAHLVRANVYVALANLGGDGQSTKAQCAKLGTEETSRALEFRADSIDALMMRGQLRAYLGDPDGARADLERAREFAKGRTLQIVESLLQQLPPKR